MSGEATWALLTDNLTQGPLVLGSGISDEGKALIWAKDKLGRPCLARLVEGEQPSWALANYGWPDTPANRCFLQAEIDRHNGEPATEVVAAAAAAAPSVTKEEALLLIEGLLADMLMLKTGAWVPDDDSIDASCEAIWRLQEFVEDLPCDS